MCITENGLHIIAGDSAAGSFKHAFKMHKRLLIHHDILACGPTPQCPDLHSWKRIRLEYLQNLFNGIYKVSFEKSRNDLLANSAMLRDAEFIYIWVTTGIEDQLLIMFLTYLLEMVEGNTDSIRVIQFEKMPDREFTPSSMGQLSSGQILKHPVPILLDQSAVNMYRSAWQALTADKPLKLIQFVTSEKQNNKYIVRALSLMLRRYPDINTGLGYWDKQLLINTSNYSPSGTKTIAYTLVTDSEDDEYVGDGYLFNRLKYLASNELPKPLIKYSGRHDTFRESSVFLTEFGKEVVDGKLSSYPVNPIDEWVGGVHLSSKEGNLWFYDNGKLVSANKT